MTDFHSVLNRLLPKQDGEQPVKYRKGIVAGVGSGVVDVLLSGVVVPDVAIHGTASVNDEVHLLVWPGDLLAIGEGGGGCSGCDLGDLADVNLAGLQDGDTIVWDATAMEWIPGSPPGASINVEDNDTFVAAATTLNFGSNLSVTDDGGGQVTIDATGGGGGGGQGNAIPVPDLSGPDDDDFSDPSLTGWTAILPTGSHSLVAGRGFLSVQFSGQTASDLAGISKSVSLSTGDSIQTAFRVLDIGAGTNFTMVGLVMGDGNTQASNKVSADIQFDGNGRRIFTRGGTWAAVGTDISSAGNPVYPLNMHPGWLHIRLTYVSADTFRHEISPDGVHWLQTPTADFTRTLTPTTVGLGWTVWGSARTPIVTFAYFKVNT